MAKSSILWEPLFLAEPQRFQRILNEEQISQRLCRWPGYEDMLLGEALRAGVREDAEAAESLRGLYRFGLENGLTVQARRDAVAGLQCYARDQHSVPFEAWLPFLEIDPDPRVARDVVAAWLNTGEDKPVTPLLALLESGSVASRGGVFGGVLCQSVSQLKQHLAPFRDGLHPQEVADALGCCEEVLTERARSFLEEWFESLEEDDLFRRDLLSRALRNPGPEHRDQRHVAERFLPPSAEIIPIRRPPRERAAQRVAPSGYGRDKLPD